MEFEAAAPSDVYEELVTCDGDDLDSMCATAGHLVALPPFEDNDTLHRYQTLARYLDDNMMQYRSDSAVVKAYIHGYDITLDQVLRHLQVARYLHTYCDFQTGRQMAYAFVRASNTHRIPKKDWRRLVNRCVMLTTTSAFQFPSPWPWELGLSPRAWMSDHSVSQIIARDVGLTM